MDLKASFDEAVKRVQDLDYRPSNENLLKLYGLFKQSIEGDVRSERPGGFDFKGIAKYDSWASLRGTTQEDAMQSYIDLVLELSK